MIFAATDYMEGLSVILSFFGFIIAFVGSVLYARTFFSSIGWPESKKEVFLIALGIAGLVGMLLLTVILGFTLDYLLQLQ